MTASELVQECENVISSGINDNYCLTGLCRAIASVIPEQQQKVADLQERIKKLEAQAILTHIATQ